MTNYYSVVQLVPDPITDERINIAVIVFSENGEVRFELTNQWNRVRSFWGHDTHSLHKLTNDFLKSNLNLEQVKSQPLDLSSSIQVTAPRNSERNTDELLLWLSDRMLAQRPSGHRLLTKSGVAAETRRSFKSAIKQHIKANDSTLRVESGFEVSGLKRTHHTDVSLHNGKAIVATRALSFLGSSRTILAKDVELCFWALEDIRSNNSGIQLAVIVAPADVGPMANQYSDATHLYASQHVPVIPIDEVHQWADSIVAAFVSIH